VRTQVEVRFKKRLPCKFRVARHAYSAMVLNLSRGGMFLQTSAGPQPGDEVWVDLNLPPPLSGLSIGAKVVWRRVVPPQLRTISAGGMGVRIQNAPESYYALLWAVAGETPAVAGTVRQQEPPKAAGARAECSSGRFRLRMGEAGGPRSRTLELSCASAEEARREALARAGAGWLILELTRL